MVAIKDSVIECSMCEALGLIPSLIKTKLKNYLSLVAILRDWEAGG
jgi:hypothetical protein